MRDVRWWMAALLAVALAGLVAALVQRGGDDEVGGDVFVVGDSLTVTAGGSELGPDGWQVHARNGRTTAEGIEVVRANDLPQGGVVIVALGTNDHLDLAETYGRRIDEMVEAIGPGHRIIWVNVDTHTADLAGAAAGVNAAIAAAPNRHRHVEVADWDRYVTTVEGFDAMRAGDGIHYVEAGSVVRSRWMQGLVER